MSVVDSVSAVVINSLVLSDEISTTGVGVVELFVLVGESAALTEGLVGEITSAEKSFESNGAVEFVDI